MKQYSRRNNVEISGTPNSIPEDDLENTVVSICKDSGVEVNPKDVESYHRFPFSRNNREQDKRVIVQFVNRKHSETLLRDKKRIISKSFRHSNVPNKVFCFFIYICIYIYIYI